MTYSLVKRLLDVLAAVCLLVLLSPLLALIVLAICLESTGSPLFFQERVGRGLRHFRIVKFRSMVRDAPLLGGWQTGDNDPRITRVGRFIRRTSLDEIPQLWNVITGDMSLIGPRPNTPQQASQYAPAAWQERHAVRPGITGLAQVSGRSNLTSEQQVAFDIEYARSFSLALDVSIALRTLSQVLRRHGVN